MDTSLRTHSPTCPKVKRRELGKIKTPPAPWAGLTLHGCHADLFQLWVGTLIATKHRFGKTTLQNRTDRTPFQKKIAQSQKRFFF